MLKQETLAFDQWLMEEPVETSLNEGESLKVKDPSFKILDPFSIWFINDAWCC